MPLANYTVSYKPAMFSWRLIGNAASTVKDVGVVVSAGPDVMPVLQCLLSLQCPQTVKIFCVCVCLFGIIQNDVHLLFLCFDSKHPYYFLQH